MLRRGRRDRAPPPVSGRLQGLPASRDLPHSQPENGVSLGLESASPSICSGHRVGTNLGGRWIGEPAGNWVGEWASAG
jgi:hypothetical protein